MTTATLSVSGMVCEGCASKIRQALEALEGVTQVDITLDAGRVDVVYTENAKTTEEKFRDTVDALGFEVA